MCILLSLLLLAPLLAGAQLRTVTDYRDSAFVLMESDAEGRLIIDLLTEGIGRMPDSVMLYVIRGGQYYNDRAFDRAIDDYNTGLVRATTTKDSLVLLTDRGGARSKIRDFEGALKDLTIAFAMDSNNVGVLNNLALVTDEFGMKQESIDYLLRIVAIDSTDHRAYINLGFLLQHRDSHQLALHYFSKAIHYQPYAPLAYSNRCYSRYALGDLDGAMEDIEVSLYLYPTNAYAYRLRALIRIAQGKTEAACSDLTTAKRYGYTQQYGTEVDELFEAHCR